MTDDREPFREPRAAWKAKHHEQRLENATYTAAEVKVLTEAALRLGRKEALEEAEAALVAEGATQRALRIVRDLISPPAPPCKTCRGLGYVPDFTNWDEYHGEPKPKPCPQCASQPAPDATSGRTDPEAK